MAPRAEIPVNQLFNDTILLWIPRDASLIDTVLPAAIAIQRADGAWSWVRVCVLWTWIVLLVVCIVPAIGDGVKGGCFPALEPFLSFFLRYRRSEEGRAWLRPTFDLRMIPCQKSL